MTSSQTGPISSPSDRVSEMDHSGQSEQSQDHQSPIISPDASNQDQNLEQINNLLQKNQYHLLSGLDDENCREENKNSIMEELRQKNERMRSRGNATSSTAANHKNSKTPAPANQSALENNVLGSANTESRIDHQHDQPTEDEHTEPRTAHGHPTTSRDVRGRPPPINILHQEQKDTSRLIESHLKTEKFYVKRMGHELKTGLVEMKKE
ncbi:hypothetical protein QAD02_001176 [Eretmocerus hayati]|uniref:Uncharacterized protein n=1 Tax=Eretmocerus hayati TaxID=131215 RepID=A0ACC2NFI3_9HYME|nr:hypothetical protein QAD02_001176 [Eretmocerus hayati]